MIKPKIGIIGVGHLGRLHAKILSQMENCTLTGIFDKDAVKAEQTGSEFGIKIYTDPHKLISESDGISIVSTTSAHFELAKMGLSESKHIFIEKPITSKISEGEEIVALAAEKNLILQVGHIERFNPAILSLEKYELDPKFIQTDRLSQFNPRGTDVAVVLDLMIHDIDIILSLVKSEVSQIHASGIAVATDNIDIANARIEFENGAVANVTASRISQKKMRKMRMFQRDSYISVDFINGVSEVFRIISDDEQPSENSISYGEIGIGEKKKRIFYEQPEIKEVNALKYELELFADSIITGRKPVVTGEDGLKALKVAERIIGKINQSSVI